ncbi:CrcB family protein [Frigoribacterium sp. CG_9.8]|uniref:fluoride efflux transporter FluC n=1 Tax=Frigoribacterium sp. CG_9.8 TaxID=2787733 RepID=UPI0018CA61DE|nr:CrcB family protein [Frigoribacterium sp. CG_9.8]MBG6108549.1 CrcB protein [Frigoribacterium sp. CG_9.8]
MPGWREAVAVVAGGVVGTGLRLTLDTVIPHGDADFPLSTLLINVVGSFALGALVATLWRRSNTPNWLKVGLGSGLIGSFTTFSALIVSLLSEAQRGAWMLAVLYLALSLVLGLGAALLGLSLGRRPRQAPLEIDMVDE